MVTGSLSQASLFFTLPTRLLTGHRCSIELSEGRNSACTSTPAVVCRPPCPAQPSASDRYGPRSTMSLHSGRASGYQTATWPRFRTSRLGALRVRTCAELREPYANTNRPHFHVLSSHLAARRATDQQRMLRQDEVWDPEGTLRGMSERNCPDSASNALAMLWQHKPVINCLFGGGDCRIPVGKSFCRGGPGAQ